MSTEWRCIFIPHDNETIAKGHTLVLALADHLTRHGGSPGSAILSREVEQGGQIGDMLYFPPALHLFAMTVPGTAPCSPPTPEGLEIYSGNQEALTALFPE